MPFPEPTGVTVHCGTGVLTGRCEGMGWPRTYLELTVIRVPVSAAVPVQCGTWGVRCEGMVWPVHTSNSLFSLSLYLLLWLFSVVHVLEELRVAGWCDPVHTSNSLLSVSLYLLLCLFSVVLEEFSRVRCEGMGWSRTYLELAVIPVPVPAAVSVQFSRVMCEGMVWPVHTSNSLLSLSLYLLLCLFSVVLEEFSLVRPEEVPYVSWQVLHDSGLKLWNISSSDILKHFFEFSYGQ